MRNIIYSFLGAVILLITSCDRLTKPHLSINSLAPYTLNISDFHWSNGTVEINKLDGDFETLDRKVFNLLKEKQGTCTVVMNIATTNKFGELIVTPTTIGTIDLTELNRYQGWEFWHKEAGIQPLLHTYLFPTQAVRDTFNRISGNLLDTSLRLNATDPNNTRRTFSFTTDDLYDNSVDKAYIDSIKHVVRDTSSDGSPKYVSAIFDVDGIITAIYPSKDLIKVKSNDYRGQHSVIVHPYKATLEARGRLILALRVGSKIKSVCMAAPCCDGYIDQLLSADITLNQ